MRRTHLRGHPKILKRLLIHVAAFNLGLAMRALCGIGKPGALQDLVAALSDMIRSVLCALWRFYTDQWRSVLPCDARVRSVLAA